MTIGRIGRPFGVRGEMHVELHTDFPERFRALRTIRLDPGHEPFEVERSRRHAGQVLLKLAGIDTPEDVQPLVNREIVVPREEAVPLPEGHYYLDDIIGMHVSTSEGEDVGTVTEVLRTGSNDVFVVNEGRDAVLVPVIRDAVSTLDIEGREIVVEPWVLREEE